MERDARRMRGDRPFLFAALRHGEGVEAIAEAICRIGGLALPGPAQAAERVTRAGSR
jgi:urease accessory protein